MSNEYITSQVPSRVCQMSKQEEILQKRKKEIELKLQMKTVKEECSFPNQAYSKEESAIVPSKISIEESYKNRFKKASSSSSECKLESAPQACASKSSNTNKGLSSKYEKVTPAPSLQVKEEDASKTDWFQDAIKRAREKAKELVPNSGVSLSAGSLPTSGSSFQAENKKRKSRWETGEPSQVAPPVLTIPVASSGLNRQQTSFNMPMNVMGMVGEGQHMEAIQGIMITRLTRSNPAIINYASKVFGTLDITDAQWKQCEEQMKMNIVFQVLQAKKNEAEILQKQGKVKYEYDSDEEVDGGTWEHKRRKQEMEETARVAEELTKETEGKHHIGDFLPPEKLSGFIEKYKALKEGRDPDLSDYRENRLTEENVGYKMLKSMGWTEGMGLGADGTGITAPVNQKPQNEKQGVGAGVVNDLNVNDDEYDAYRKRMMLAYRFRPNPLNNPRRSYY